MLVGPPTHNRRPSLSRFPLGRLNTTEQTRDTNSPVQSLLAVQLAYAESAICSHGSSVQILNALAKRCIASLAIGATDPRRQVLQSGSLTRASQTSRKECARSLAVEFWQNSPERVTQACNWEECGVCLSSSASSARPTTQQYHIELQ
ncbi:hypothetical protein Plec18167_001618 [Paecilomyces lecythidis]|uniref:Uncharacterized protein n=1 Tax=Paecilomyces lecythidis TaxID=3004212 RepID=A0ABR3Y9H6_9EURO